MANGLLQVVSEQTLQDREAKEIEAFQAVNNELDTEVVDQLAHYIRTQYWEFRRHRIRRSIHRRILASQRAYNGQYDVNKLQQIKAFGGSDVYARLTAIKCRGATAMLRDVYMSGERPWALRPTPVADLPGDLMAKITSLVALEVQTLQQSGVVIDESMIAERQRTLEEAAKKATEKQARDRSKNAEDYLDDLLVEGGFYDAFAEFLLDITIFPLAIIKGPVVQLDTEISWDEDRNPVINNKPKFFWKRVSPFDIYFTPSASSLEEADIIERGWLQRIDVQKLLGVPGYDDKAIMGVLKDYTNGLYDNLDDQDTERAELEDKENPHLNRSRTINTLEFHGYIPGKLLRDWNGGSAVSEIKDFNPDLDYHVTTWVMGRYSVKVQVTPNPRKRHPYFGTSFEKVPGAVVGRSLPEILDDSQHVANAALRSLVNNMAFASGPQVGINEDRMSPSMNTDVMEPWKRWRFQSDSMGSSEPPIIFFQPNSNASELMSIFEKMMNLSDEVSGIPRYLTGNQNVGGAASTASGLNMLMSNASKVLQLVAAQIDTELFAPLLRILYDMLLLTDDSELIRGDDDIQVLGVSMAISRERDLQRQLEFLQMTANPIDQQIVGPRGRASIYRELAENLGLSGENIVPSDEHLARLEQQEQEMMAAQAAQAQGAQAPAPGPADNRPNRGLDNAMRTRTPRAIANQSQP